MAGQRKSRTKLIVAIVLYTLVLLYIGISIWYILDLRSRNNELTNALQEKTTAYEQLKQEIITQPAEVVAKLQEQTTESVLEAVKKLYSVPEDENPTVATVQDITKLKDQPFFEGAQNGDVLIVFEKNAQAILYRPSENRLVKVGPISVNQETPTTNPAPAAEAQP